MLHLPGRQPHHVLRSCCELAEHQCSSRRTWTGTFTLYSPYIHQKFLHYFDRQACAQKKAHPIDIYIYIKGPLVIRAQVFARLETMFFYFPFCGSLISKTEPAAPTLQIPCFSKGTTDPAARCASHPTDLVGSRTPRRSPDRGSCIPVLTQNGNPISFRRLGQRLTRVESGVSEGVPTTPRGR